MLYSIVDIETTGGHASANGITEISICVHDGNSVIKKYESLINPSQPIPYYIRGLTGINDAMVASAPKFKEVAKDIYEVLDGTVFVAHSVNFDYSFVKHALAESGYELNLKKLCTVRLSRKIFPGLASYSLGNICGYLNISINNRHRAGGDTEATVKLFELLLRQDTAGVIEKFLKRGSKDQALPPNLPKEHFEQLPNAAGVYYFHNQKGKVVYVGKAKDIKKRVSSHFSNNSPQKQKQDFLRSIHGITFEVCGNELMAMILESHQIKHFWPEHNRSQKRFEPVYGILDYLDQRGLKRLGIEKIRKHTKALVAFSNLMEGFGIMRRITNEFELCPRLTGLATDTAACKEKGCVCITGKKKGISSYNQSVDAAIESLTGNDSFVIVEEGRKQNEKALVVVDKGVFSRMGYVSGRNFLKDALDLQSLGDLPQYKENFNIRQMISSYRNRYPENVIMLTSALVCP